MTEPRIGSLFSGYGGLDMGVQSALGGTVAWHVEFDAAPSRILAHHWPDTPNYGDITSVDWAEVEPVDILTGGFPCQDLSHAGKRLGLRPGTRSGLWEHMAYAINELRPRMVVIENVRGLLSATAHSDTEPHRCWCVGDSGDEPVRALGAVLWDLAELGYNARWGGVRAADAGAPHGRFRVFIVAQPADAGRIGAQVPAGWGFAAESQPGGDGAARGVGLSLLPTPKGGSDGPNGGPGMRNGRGVVDALPGAVSLLPTPTSQAAKHGGTPDVNANGYGSNLWDLPHLEFGPYAPAIARWEQVLGRPAPSPTEPGKDGRPRLSPLFVEWMMGLPAGHVTDPAIGLTRAQQLKALGNGVVPQQAALALRMLLHNEPPMPILRTVTASESLIGRPDRYGTVWFDLTDQIAALTLLLTPAVNDMGEGKTVDDWDEWTGRMKTAHRNGNGHGKSLSIEAQRFGHP